MADLQRLAIASWDIHDQLVRLTTEQQHYLTRVLRLGEGDRFIAMDGVSQWWLAVLQVDPSNPNKLIASLEEQLPVKNELPVRVTLIVALPKKGLDDLARYACELGVTSIVPIISARTLLKPSPQKLERWRRIAAEAAEQSERQMVPTILEPGNFTTFLSDVKSKPSLERPKYICVARKNAPHLLDLLVVFAAEKLDLMETKTEFLPNHNSSIIIATGPEGGWTNSEVEEAIAAGFQPVSLGRRILRAVTAPIVALSLVTAALEAKLGDNP